MKLPDDLVQYEMWATHNETGEVTRESVWTTDWWDDFGIINAKGAVEHMNNLNNTMPYDAKYSNKTYFVMEVRTVRSPL